MPNVTAIARWPALMTEAQAAAYLSLSAETVRQLRLNGNFVRRVVVPAASGKDGHRRAYRIEDLDAWRFGLSYENSDDGGIKDYRSEWGECG